MMNTKLPDWRKSTREQKEMIRKLYEGKMIGSCEISKIVGKNPKTIRRWLKRMGVKIRDRSEAVHLAKKIELKWNQYQLDVIRGELLGDGCIMKKYKRRSKMDYQFIINLRSKEHALYLKKILPDGLFHENAPWKVKRNGIWTLTSRSDPVFTEMCRQWYCNRRKVLPPDLSLNSTIVLHWYLGDGYLQRLPARDPTSILCTDGFTEKEVNRLIGLLAKSSRSTKISNGMNTKKGDGFRIRISTKDTLSFLKWIGNPHISDYEHKWLKI